MAESWVLRAPKNIQTYKTLRTHTCKQSMLYKSQIAYKCAQLNRLPVPPCTRPFLTINGQCEWPHECGLHIKWLRRKHYILLEMMVEATRKTKKRNFTEVEVETLVGEVEAWKLILFGGHTTGITNKKKQTEWQQVAAAVNAVSHTERTVAELKKKWSDIKVHIFIPSRTAHVCNLMPKCYWSKTVYYRWMQSGGCPPTAKVWLQCGWGGDPVLLTLHHWTQKLPQ